MCLNNDFLEPTEEDSEVNEASKEQNGNEDTVENGHKEIKNPVQSEETIETVKETPEKKDSPEKEMKSASPVKEADHTSLVEEKIPIPQPSEASPKHRERSDTPEREVSPKVESTQDEMSSKDESSKNDAFDRGISEEPVDEEEDRPNSPSREQSIQQVSG